MDHPSRTTIKAFAALGTLCLLGTAGTVILTPPASGYEISIYEAFPGYFWALLIGAFCFGQLTVLSSAVGAEGDDGWIAGVALIAVASATVVLLPAVRGYPIYGRADVLTHIGLIRDLETVGIANNIYPPTHILTQALAGATGIEAGAVVNLVPVVFTVLFFGASALVAVHLFERRRALFCLPVMLLPIMGSSFLMVIPFLLSVLLVPLVLFLFLKEQETQAVKIRILLILSIIGVVVYHPLTAVFLLVVAAMYSVLGRTPIPSADWSLIPNVTSLMLVVFSAWYMQYAGIIIRFRNIANDFIGRAESESQLDATVQTVSSTGPELTDLLQIALLERGGDLLIYGFAALFLAIVGLRWVRHGDRPDMFRLLFLLTAMAFGGIATVFLTMDLTAGYGRPLLFGRVFAVLFVGALFHTLWAGAQTDRGRLAATGSFSIVLFVLVFLMVFSIFGSPLVFERNAQVTEMEIEGSEWLFEERNEELLIEERGIYQYRYYHYHYGLNDAQTIRWGGASPPAHFNYTERDTLGRSYDDERYMILTKLARIEYQERFPDYEDQWQFTPTDFERVEVDPTVHRVYDNGEFNVYRVNGTAGTSDAGENGTVGTAGTGDAGEDEAPVTRRHTDGVDGDRASRSDQTKSRKTPAAEAAG